MKKCIRCGLEFLLEEFYTHKEMADGYLNICKGCVKSRVNKHRQANLESIQAYDRSRNATKERREQNRRITAEWRLKNPDRRKAQMAVNNAIRDGRLVRQSCWCGKTGEGHHPDYSQPLLVVWLCREHHMRLHRRKNGVV